MLCGVARAQKMAVYFDFDSYELSDKTKAVLDSAFAEIKYYQGVRADIQGFTDDKGTSGYNDTLALNRAHAVEGYLKRINPTLNCIVYTNRISQWPDGTPDAQKRRVTITMQDVRECGYMPEYQHRVTAPNGVIVIAANFTNKFWPPYVTTSFSAAEMLKNNRYGLDTEGNVLKSWGMIDIDAGGSDDGYYTVMVPISGQPDPNMSIWTPGDENSGNVRWKDTDTKIEIDPTGKYYVFRVPVSKSGSTRVNLDMPCQYEPQKPRNAFKNSRKAVYKTVYVATSKPYKFYDVSAGVSEKKSNMGFSAKINDTLYAFTVERRIKTKDLKFFGWEQGSNKVLSFSLKRCDYSLDNKKNEHYAMNKHTLDKEKTGFWAWLGRLFS